MQPFANIASLLTAVTLLFGCGSMVGNPKVPNPIGNGGGESKYVRLEIPHLGFGIPSSTSTEETPSLSAPDQLNLMPGAYPPNSTKSLRKAPPKMFCKNIFDCTLFRLDKDIRSTNKILARLRGEEKVDRIGRFRKRGLESKTNITTFALTDGVFRYAAIICRDDRKFMEIKWSADGNQVQIIRQLKQPLFEAASGEDRIASFLYQGGDKPTIETRVTGLVPPFDDLEQDGSTFSDYTKATQESGRLVITTVNDWYSGTRSGNDTDAYLAGQVEDNGQGIFVSYRQANKTACKKTFDPKNPQWCLTGTRASEESSAKESVSENAKALGAINLPEDDKLDPKSFDPKLECGG